MLVVTRFDIPAADAEDFMSRAQAALAALAACRGYLRGRIGRAADDPTAWVLSTEWVGVGAYRRSLSSYDVKVTAAPLLSLARDEVSAFEILFANGDVEVELPSRRAADADEVAVGAASGPAEGELPLGGHLADPGQHARPVGMRELDR